jgi:ribosomal protein S18 acetylase RimI-like enzyme
MKILRLKSGDEHVLLASAELFDAPPTETWAEKFLLSEGHHLLVAVDDSGHPLGFVSGVETTHPDKGTEMFLYELSVAEVHRNRGIGTALVKSLADLARAVGCYGMWVGTEPANAAALATYRAAGAASPEPFVTLDWIFDDRSSSTDA